MKINAKVVCRLENNQIGLRQVKEEEIRVYEDSYISIDGSTSTTGVSIFRLRDGAIYYSIAVSREDKEESPVRYKLRLKKFIEGIINNNNGLIKNIYYEEPCIEHRSAIANIFMLRTFIEEMIIENEPNMDNIKHIEINNMKWKRIFLFPQKVPQGTENQKKAVRDKLIKYAPYLASVTQDEVDSIVMGITVKMKMNTDSEEDLQTKKAPHKFQYNITFSASDDDDETIINELHEIYTGPDSILSNGITFADMPPTCNFDKKIYELMGNEDKVLVVKFKSNKHGNIILKHRIGHLASSYSHIYGVVWRKARKR